MLARDRGQEMPGVWRLTGITLEPGPLRAALDPDAPATLDLCLATPDRCID